MKFTCPNCGNQDAYTRSETSYEGWCMGLFSCGATLVRRPEGWMLRGAYELARHAASASNRTGA